MTPKTLNQSRANALQIKTPRWSLPLLKKKRYKGAKGGRGSGKSHFFAEAVVEEAVMDPNVCIVCIREVQKSLRFSAKRLIENKIRSLGVSHLFNILREEIRMINGDGVIIFQGMQDHTADSIKSLEGFRIAWCEEAQSLSKRSMDLLLPTIREDHSELWFSWNPDQPDAPVEELFRGTRAETEGESAETVCAHVNFDQNPWCTEELKREAARHLEVNPDSYDHVWLGGYDVRSDRIIFSGKYEIRDFEPSPGWNGPYFGLDFGFADDPTAGTKSWVHDETLYIEYECYRYHLEIDEMPAALIEDLPDIKRHICRADNARPDTISYIRRHGLPKMRPCKKGSGSIEDGISHIKSYRRVVIHARCHFTALEFSRYSFKVDKLSGDILPVPIDKDNHAIDAERYALEPIMKKRGKGSIF